jgi:hypothetical protein
VGHRWWSWMESPAFLKRLSPDVLYGHVGLLL